MGTVYHLTKMVYCLHLIPELVLDTALFLNDENTYRTLWMGDMFVTLASVTDISGPHGLPHFMAVEPVMHVD